MTAAAKAKKPLIDYDDIIEIFSNVEGMDGTALDEKCISQQSTNQSIHQWLGLRTELVQVNTMLLEGISRLTSSFDPDKTMIGEYFCSMTEYLRCYTKFVNNYDTAVALLSRYLENDNFKQFLQKLTDGGMKGLSIFSYLIMPIQRVPRYVLLLEVCSGGSGSC